jgi:hypothetical protein
MSIRGRCLALYPEFEEDETNPGTKLAAEHLNGVKKTT